MNYNGRDAEKNAAYDQGKRDRLKGRTLKDCPYSAAFDLLLYQSWRNGWIEADCTTTERQ